MVGTGRHWSLSRYVVPTTFAAIVSMGSAYADVNLRATGSDGKVSLSWTTTDNLRSVQVMRDTDANPAGRQRVAILAGNARSYTDNAVTNGRQYWYWIKYVDTVGIVGNSNAGSAKPAASDNKGNAGAACANALPLVLPKVFTGAMDTCLVTSESIESVNSWGAETLEINGVSYKSKWSNQMPPRINGNYYIRYVAKQFWAHFEINGNDNGGDTQPVAVSGVSVMPTIVTVAINSTSSLSATVVPSNATNRSVTWTSSNTGVATVSASGIVAGVAAGNAVITARTVDGGRTAMSVVTVPAKPDPVVNYTLTMGIRGNGTTSLSTGSHSYKSGSVLAITATPASGSVFSGWSGAFSGNTNPLTVTMDGNKSLTAMFSTQSSDSGGQCQAYSWPGYKPDLNYDFRQDFSNIDPSKFTVYEGCPKGQIAGVKTSGWYAFIWGKNRNPSITDADIDRVLKNLNEDMAYAREQFGWPPDRLAQEGHFSNIYLFGSGLCTDSALNTEKGGWQSDINGYPMVLLSYYPVVTPSERGGITHEAIHATLATMGNKAAWFNEGGNTWLQMNMEAARTGGYGVGFLDGAPFLAPHIPIENYSGWLQDGTFGGPNAEGVNRSNASGQQISTWRAYLGGNQYNSAFAHFLALHVSPGANAWIWKKGTENSILASLAGGLGVEQTRHLIMEYRARQAMVDFGPWADGFKVPINDNWGRTIGAERIDGGILQEPAPYRLGFYAQASKQGDTLVPATETLPGWSGANQIPLQVSGNKVRVNFKPIGQNMRLQLAYRAKDGSAVYSQPVANGEACLSLDKAPKDGSVVAVVSNVDHLYQGEETRKRKHDYRIQLLEGVSGTASTTDKHYQ